MFLPVFRTYFTMVLYVNGGRSSSSLSIFFAEGHNLNFSSFSLTSRSFCFEHEVQLRSLDYFDHFARDRLYTFHSAQKKNQQGTLILNLQSLRQKKRMRQKAKVH